MISGLIYLQASSTLNEEVKKILSLSQSRIQSIALIHELLYQSETLSTIHFEEFIQKLVKYLRDIYQSVERNILILIDSDDIILNVNQAIPSALLINEMVINAFEHAFEGRESGTINIKTALHNNEISIEVRDNGIGLPENINDLQRNTLGMKLIKTLAAQLKTEIIIDNSQGEGAAFKVTYELMKDLAPVRLF